MASVIHFKFRSALAFEAVSFDGDYLSLQDLKRLIAKKKGLTKALDIDLQLTESNTGEEFADEAQLIPKNTSVLVKKVNAKVQNGGLEDAKNAIGEGKSAVPVETVSSFSETKKPVATNEADDDEEEKLRQMMEQQNADWQRQQQQRKQQHQHQHQSQRVGIGQPSGATKPPPYYVCSRCEQGGHWKKDCPTNGDPAYDTKKYSVGIPISRTRVLRDQSGQTSGDGIMRLPDGRLVLTVPADEEFERHMKSGAQEVPVPADGSIPKELQDAYTKDLVLDAAVLPCCQSNVGMKIMSDLLNDSGACPICLQPDIFPDMLKPNSKLRASVAAFLRSAKAKGIKLQSKVVAASEQREEKAKTPPRTPPLKAEEAKKPAEGVPKSEKEDKKDDRDG
eukprot:CAMPEP_0206238848 /NCGR_PEP_ID=MMETSP0047_2-20121206/15045_1 /ASSEMBLY_ACC=CAM_ASM_000192 /TAXON_ID=195065 /ORGANISM="Chroomonas mesostigmatica_cf, Strain CCMP1168" /LENGTH=391 /DNA_ID=CAMNT_0053663433 /DNA_START=40 /DNA_END=1212 /DNA_ORIENTATION=-